MSRDETLGRGVHRQRDPGTAERLDAVVEQRRHRRAPRVPVEQLHARVLEPPARVNLTGAFLMAKARRGRICAKGRGAIVNVRLDARASSRRRNTEAYSASKAGSSR